MKKHGIENPKKLLPDFPRLKLDFEVNDSYSGFANAIRRTLIEEIPVYCMDFEIQDFNTEDKFLLYDFVLKQINLIPINQDINNIDKIKISLFKINKTNKEIKIKSGDIEVKSNQKLINDNNIVLFKLKPGKKIYIKNIRCEFVFYSKGPV